MLCEFSATFFANPQALIVLTVQAAPRVINHAGKSIELLGFMCV